MKERSTGGPSTLYSHKPLLTRKSYHVPTLPSSSSQDLQLTRDLLALDPNIVRVNDSLIWNTDGVGVRGENGSGNHQEVAGYSLVSATHDDPMEIDSQMPRYPANLYQGYIHSPHPVRPPEHFQPRQIASIPPAPTISELYALPTVQEWRTDNLFGR